MGNKSAATRSRKHLTEMKNRAKEVRDAIQDAEETIISVEPIEHMTQIIFENNDLASLQGLAKRLGLGGGLGCGYRKS